MQFIFSSSMCDCVSTFWESATHALAVLFGNLSICNFSYIL